MKAACRDLLADGKRAYPMALVFLLALIVVSVVAVPRFLAYGPGIAGILFFVFYMKAMKQKPAFSKPAFLFTAGVGILTLASSLWAFDPGDALHRAARLSLVMLGGAFLFSLAAVFDLRRLKPYLWMIPAAVMLTAVLIVFELECGAPLYNAVRGLAPGSRVQPAEFNRAAVAVVLCFFPAMAILKQYMPGRRSFGLAAVSLLPMLALTDSQSAQMAFVLGLLFMLAFPYRFKAAWIVLAAALAALMLAAPFLSIGAFRHFAMELQALPVIGSGGAYAGNRLEIWDYVSRYALARPVTGFGIEAARHITDFDSREIFQQGKSILHPHNFAIQLWLEFGVIGALCGAGAIGYILNAMKARLSAAQARMALPAMIAALSVGSTGYGMWQGWWLGLLWLAASFCILAIRLEADSPKTVA